MQDRAGEPISTDEFLRILEETGSQGVNLSRRKLASINLDAATLADKLGEYRESHGDRTPKWWSDVGDVARLDLRGIILEDADLIHAKLPGADFFDARLRLANFGRADLSGSLLLWADLSESSLISANLSNVSLYGANLQGADLTFANTGGVLWERAALGRTRLSRGQLTPSLQDEVEARKTANSEKFQKAAEAYVEHRLNFLSLGRYDDASWAHVKAQRLKTDSNRLDFLNYENTWRSRTAASFRWISSKLWDWLSGYGETPQKPLAWAGVLALILFPLIYWIASVPDRSVGGDPSAIDSLTYSLTTFGTLSFDRLQPTTTAASILSSTEAFAGVLLFSMFIFTLGNRVGK